MIKLKPHKQHDPLLPTRLLRKCHLRKLYRRRRQVGWTPPIQSRRMKDWQIDGMNQIFPGFARWYRASYDEHGYLLPRERMPGLRSIDYLLEQTRQEIVDGEFDEDEGDW